MPLVSEVPIYVGQGIRAEVQFVNQLGAAADPDTVTFIVQRPDETELTWTWTNADPGIVIQRTGVGAFYMEFIVTTSGYWYVRAEGTGNNIDAPIESEFFVKPTHFGVPG